MTTSSLLSDDLSQALRAHQGSSHENGYFVYDIGALKQHLTALQQQDVVKLWYAVKANPLSSVIQAVAESGIQFDVASKGELTQVLLQGVDAEKILNTGPAKSYQQISYFLQQGVNTFVVESYNQLQWLALAAKEQDKKPDALLRVQLRWPEGEKNPLGGNSLTPFGLGTEEWAGIRASDFPTVNICGLHIFQWGNMLSNSQMFSLWSQMVEPLVSLAERIGFELKVLDLGGGLGVDYLETGQGIDWQQAMADLAQIKAQAGVEELWLELGRYAVAPFGYYVTDVVDRKTNFGEEQLVLAAGINHLLRPAITDQPFPASLLRPSSEQVQDFHLHGPLCTSMDSLGKLPLPSDTKVGDQLVFSLSGAYGFTESMPLFLCHEVAAEYVYDNHQLTEVRAAQPATWYMR
ncbi:PLP-dependent decarboxylase [Thalassotalea euphylliae]|uniref:PLP-dependent decarboxylase n=1 Tax=Thalassotalea euphylliae TaxID=1655234 RepID=A0A3E0U1E5_9GAMM|nr:PLP-dependent decarboxylase [Thalassotalea euphylliae]REL30781.1 PLP-dependent decarboxylase [Thalassotalea euphylliae]